MKEIVLPVHGMSCQKCVAKVSAALSALPGVQSVRVSLEAVEAGVCFDESLLDRRKIISAIERAGFTVPAGPLREAASPPPGEKLSAGASGQWAPARTVLAIRGMTCANCARSIEKGVARLPGVRRAAVNFAAEKLSVEYDPALLTTDDLTAKVRDLGYQGILPESAGRLSFAIQGMHCSSCAGTIEKRLLALEGVRSVKINFAEDSAAVEFDPERLGRDVIFAAVREAGYTPLEERGAAEERGEARRALRWVLFAAACSFPIMALMWWQPFGDATLFVNAALATVVQFSAGLTFYNGAWKSLKNRSANMDVLVTMGITAAWGYSMLAAFHLFGVSGEVFFRDRRHAHHLHPLRQVAGSPSQGEGGAGVAQAAATAGRPGDPAGRRRGAGGAGQPGAGRGPGGGPTRRKGPGRRRNRNRRVGHRRIDGYR